MKIYNSLAALQLTTLLFSSSPLGQAQMQWETEEDETRVCLLVYSLADNNLEYFLRQDLVELIQSPAIDDPSLTTWVYFDQRNLQDTPYETGGDPITTPLPFLYQESGAPFPSTAVKHEGSSYLRYDQGLAKMVVDTRLEGERNGDDVQTPYDFLVHALPDCIAKGATEYFMIFSSHGGGFQGFGGDENLPPAEVETSRSGNPDFDGRRKLVQNNQNIVNAIYYALQDVEGAPDMLDVIGFDACLMSAIGSIDEYRDIAKYVLASEAIEPGHGWAYDKLDTAESALAMAESLAFHFLNTTQADTEWYADVHQTPKTISLVDTAEFTVFHQAWEELTGELVTLLNNTKDPYLHTAVTRARAETLAFVSIDSVKSAADVGHFLDNFMEICNIDPDSTLHGLWTRALETYDDQFIARGVGNGTSTDATGMHVFWPLKNEYQTYPDYYNEFLFWEYENDDTPNWNNFVWSYVAWSAPTVVDDVSVCLNSLTSEVEPTYEGQLLLSPYFYFDPDSGDAVFTSDVTIETDWVLVDYGFSLNHLLSNRKLRERAARSKPTPAGANSNNGRRRMAHGQRRTQDEENTDYYYMLGGDAAVHFNGPVAKAEWDRQFYFLTTPDILLENIYVFDYGGGSKSFPVCYFPPNNLRSREDFEGTLMTVEEAKADLGCIEGEVFFSIFEGLGSTFSLYTYNNATGVQSEVPRTAGGQVVPITYMDMSISGFKFTEIVGGANQTIAYWNPFTQMEIVQYPDTFVLDAYDSESIEIGMFASDWDATDPLFDYDSHYFYYTREHMPIVEDSTVSKTEDDGGRLRNRNL